MLIFVEEGKPKNLQKNPRKNPRSRATTNNKLNPHTAPGRNRIRDTLVGGNSSHHRRHPCFPTLSSLRLVVGLRVRKLDLALMAKFDTLESQYFLSIQLIYSMSAYREIFVYNFCFIIGMNNSGQKTM